MKGKPVLIVDDEKNIRLMLSRTLEALELKTDTAINGAEALTKLAEKEFGLILLDLKMPGMDGMEVLRQVRQIKPNIPIIIITAHGSIELAVEAMKLGAVDFIQKPFAPKEIRELVSRVVDGEKFDKQPAADYTIVIIGCGRLGRYLANQLSRDGHSVVVVDIDKSTFEKLSPEYGGFRVEGDATELSVLKQTKIEEADIVIATTREDNVNLMVAQAAQRFFHVPKVMARVFEPSREGIFRELGIETVCPTSIAAEVCLEWVRNLQLSTEQRRTSQ